MGQRIAVDRLGFTPVHGEIGRPGSFDGDASTFRLVSEAHRIRFRSKRRGGYALDEKVCSFRRTHLRSDFVKRLTGANCRFRGIFVEQFNSIARFKISHCSPL